MTDMRNILAESSFSKPCKTLCKPLLPLLEKPLHVRGYSRTRMRLNSLMHTIQDKRKVEVIQCFLFLLKKRYSRTVKAVGDAHDHPVTDHAFCTALRRYFGTTLIAEKDAVLAMAEKNGWPYAQKDGKVITFYPPEAA